MKNCGTRQETKARIGRGTTEGGCGGYLPERTVATETSNSVVPDGKRQLSDEKLAGVAGGRIPPLPEIPTTTTL